MRPVIAALVLAALGAQPAEAGTFHVYGLGLSGAGCPNGWVKQEWPAKKFDHVSRCSRWKIRSRGEDGALKRGASAGISMVTDAGARFTGFSIKSRGTARNGTYWTVSFCRTPYRRCGRYYRLRDTWNDTDVALGSLASGGSTLDAQHIWAGVRCGGSKCPDSAKAGRAANVTHVESHAVVEDYTAPGTPQLDGVSTGWNSGQKQLTYSATDAGSGVDSVTLTVDGSLHRTITHSCTRLPTGGYTQPVPCATSTSGEFTVNEPGQLADGRHSLTLGVRDAGRAWTAATQELWVDNNAPGHPLGLAVEGGDGWRNQNDFAVTWENPEQGNGSGIAAAYYKVGSAPETATDGFRIDGGATAAQLEVPRDGEWKARIWLEDEAGNSDAGNVAVATLRLDTTAPALAFRNERSPENPAEVRVETFDEHSGLADGQIEIRRLNTAEWQPLETRREGTDLVAAVPDDQLERGTYELRATAWDAVGNTATTGVRADGQPMVLDVPLRADTTLSASLARRAGGARHARQTIRIRYRKRAWLRGVLRSGAVLLPDTRIAVETRRLPNGDWSPLTELVTDGHGRYAVRLPRGTSRDVRVVFPGNRSLQPATNTARLLVRSWASLKLRPRTLRRGGTITFRGQVGLFKANVPQAGKLVQIQYLDGRRWRPAVKLGHTNRRGRFSIKYRFKRISRPTKIYFRILVPAEGDWPYVTGASPIRTAFVTP